MATSHGGPLAVALNDLQHIFSDRLRAFVAYGPAPAAAAASLAIVDTITADDLDRCASHAANWHRAGCATPLFLTREEFAGSLDSFPIEYGEIIETHQLLYGANPFDALEISREDLRRACEMQVKSHLVHLRENYVECRGRQTEIAALVHDAAPAFRVLLRRLARLDGVPAETPAELGAYAAGRPGLDARVVGDVLATATHSDGAGVDAAKLYPAYLAAVERLWQFIDRWRAEAR